MLRGAQKHMIVVRTRNSRLFEEAYFVMRREADASDTDRLDMLWEANRILESALPRGEAPPEAESARPRRMGLLRALWFALGGLCGGGAVGLLWLFL